MYPKGLGGHTAVRVMRGYMELRAFWVQGFWTVCYWPLFELYSGLSMKLSGLTTPETEAAKPSVLQCCYLIVSTRLSVSHSEVGPSFMEVRGTA